MNIEETKNEIKELIKGIVPEEIQVYVKTRKILGEESIFVGLACSDININRVDWQKPQLVCLYLSQNWELEISGIAGRGGGNVWRKPNMDHPKEKYLAMCREKVPFRRPKKEKKAVFKAIERFALRYIDTLKKHKDVLMYSDIVNYGFLD